MGCDIHLIVEKRRVKEGWFEYYKGRPADRKCETEFRQDIPIETEWWCCLITSRNTWSNRQYGMFAKLANVRNQWDIKPIPIRGLPEDMCFNTFLKYVLMVVPDSKYDVENYDTISESMAEEYVKNGYAKEITFPNIPDGWERIKFITNEYHSANWCTSKELEEAINEIFYIKEVGDYVSSAGEWIALLYYMKGLESAGFETRCVFWFDN